MTCPAGNGPVESQIPSLAALYLFTVVHVLSLLSWMSFQRRWKFSFTKLPWRTEREGMILHSVWWLHISRDKSIAQLVLNMNRKRDSVASLWRGAGGGEEPSSTSSWTLHCSGGECRVLALWGEGIGPGPAFWPCAAGRRSGENASSFLPWFMCWASTRGLTATSGSSLLGCYSMLPIVNHIVLGVSTLQGARQSLLAAPGMAKGPQALRNSCMWDSKPLEGTPLPFYEGLSFWYAKFKPLTEKTVCG